MTKILTKVTANDLGFFEPQIHFTYSAIELWRREGFTFQQIKEALEELRVATKKATGYFWDNEHIFVDDIYGKPALQIMVHEDGIDLWETNHGTHVGTFVEIPEDITKLINNEIHEGKVRCSEGGEWVKKFIKYSYAGAVCHEHFDPKKHKAPDSSG